MSVGAVAATPASPLTCPGLGLGTSFQAVPFQRTTSVRSLVLVRRVPTAQALPAEVAATESRLLWGSGWGGGPGCGCGRPGACGRAGARDPGGQCAPAPRCRA